MAGSDDVFHADLHVHSRFSRACSKDSEIPHLAWWAARKGVTVVGTGDFTHPAWAAGLAESLVPAEPGLFRLRPELVSRLRRTLPPSCTAEIRFLLSTEISTIYKRDGATRKVHHLLYAPTFEAAGAITAALAKVGNLASDGRPILGLDSRHLLEITLNAGPGCFLIPAHIWTPWFAVLGSKSGFDAVPDCYLDLSEHVFAVETGLSSDPPMNWICSALDHYRFVSNSDAHSPPMIGREATTFSTTLDYFAMLRALRTGQGLAGTLNFFPEGGRYHLDGHRKCGVRFFPAESARHGGVCPECGKPQTIGVLHRVAELADRPEGYRPPGAAASANLVSLPEIIGEIRGTGRHSKRVTVEVDRLVAALGPELHILCDADPDDIRRAAGGLVAEAIARLRNGEVIKEAGYDGEYGVIRLFRPEELAETGALFDIPASSVGREESLEIPALAVNGEELFDAPAPAVSGEELPDAPAVSEDVLPGAAADAGATRAAGADGGRTGSGPEAPAWHEGDRPGGLLAGLDPGQREAALAAGPLMILAGPGTGKTRTLTHRIAVLVAGCGVAPEACLALTFTRRAAAEMRERLAALLPGQARRLMITTFHGLGLAILREHGERAGLDPGFTVADDRARLAVAAAEAGSAAAGRRLLAEASRDPAAAGEFARLLAARGMVDFDGLISLTLALLQEEPDVAAALRARWLSISVDEYQDTDAGQHALLRLLAGDGGGLAVIGDPDQAIYGFRGADVGFFLSFEQDYPGARTVALTRNYRSSPVIVSGAIQAVAPATLVPDRRLNAVADDTDPGRAGPGTASRITVHEAATEQAEAAWIAKAVDRLLGGASFHSLDSGRADGHAGGKVALADMAVLYRTDAQATALGQALTRAGLPFQKRSHDLLSRRAAVPDILREMRDVPWSLPGRSTPGPSVSTRLKTAVYGLATRVQDGRKQGARAAAVDVLAAGEVLAPLADRCGTDFDRFLTEIALGAEADALDPRADAVTLLTMHAAKGLEFSVVFVAGCERGLVPLWLPGSDPGGPDIAEERRLLFVAMTRARTHLFLTYAARRRKHATVAETGPSPFLASIDPRLLDRPAAPPRRSRPTVVQPRLL
jgi:DNA helicase II / ATP-dependent DNA helicase PcrA